MFFLIGLSCDNYKGIDCSHAAAPHTLMNDPNLRISNGNFLSTSVSRVMYQTYLDINLSIVETFPYLFESGR